MSYKFEALSISVKGMINPVKEMEIKKWTEERLLFCFHQIIDRNRALEGCPWSFKKNILILNEIKWNENLMQVNLDLCDFFIHIHDLSLVKMNLGRSNAYWKYFNSQKHVSKMHAWWIEYLQHFTFTLKHKSRQQNWVADALSRRSELLLTLKSKITAFEMLKDLYETDEDLKKICEQCHLK